MFPNLRDPPNGEYCVLHREATDRLNAYTTASPFY